MFNQRLELALMRAQRNVKRLAVMFIDLDRFKIINDTLGHESGDLLLREVAQRITDNLHTGDIVARLGGDEFAILASDLTLRQAENRFARTLSDLGTTESIGGSRGSCGLAEYSAGDTYEGVVVRGALAL